MRTRRLLFASAIAAGVLVAAELAALSVHAQEAFGRMSSIDILLDQYSRSVCRVQTDPSDCQTKVAALKFAAGRAVANLDDIEIARFAHNPRLEASVTSEFSRNMGEVARLADQLALKYGKLGQPVIDDL